MDAVVTTKCTRHRESKIETVKKIDGRKYICSYCYSCWELRLLKMVDNEFEQKQQQYNSQGVLSRWFSTPPSITNKYKLKKMYREHANSGIKLAKEYKEELKQEFFHKNTPTNFDVILKLSGVDFENYIEELFRTRGYSVTKTPATGDGGVDLVINKKVNNITIRTAVQCKRYTNSVGVSAIQEVFTGKHIYKCKDSMVITTSKFTTPAVKTAKELKVTLWDKYKLVEEINKTFPMNKNHLTFDEFLTFYSVEDEFPY